MRNIVCNHIGYYYIGAIVQPAANHLQESYIKSRFYYTPNEWPPYHPKHYTTLALIHHKGKRVNTEVISVTQELVTEGNLSKSHPLSGNISYHSKDISELFPTNLISSYFLLIEGAPGIGKTILCKEIAYQWAEKKLLKFKKLVFLLFLRDPTIKQLMSLESLIQYFFESTKIASDLSEHFFQAKGKGLVFIFDGYDEMSEEDRNNSLVAKIINRNVLPECDLVITSRPSASLCLRDVADCRVEVLGFTEEDRLDYIQHALKGSADKIEALQFYLQSNSTINALCYVPLNMTILLCLFEEVECLSHSALDLDNKEDIGLPNTQTEMYEKFILMTITRFIKKSNKKFSGKCLTFSDLPEPYNEAFNELLHLAYNALTKDQIVFSLNDKVVQACPILKSGKYGGLGVLKVTEYVSNVSFHFLHFSIQESLAAYYIASQSSSFQVQLLRDTFWNIHYFNTWIMYVGMTGGKKIAWKHFISGNWFILSTKIFKSSKISKRYLNDKIKSLHLFQCFAEIGNKELVGKVFKDKIIDLSNQTLLPRDINTICFFLLRSVNKHWIKLDLSNCNIGDTGSDILCKTFLDKSRDIVGIDRVDLSHNQLQSHSILGLLDVFKVWHTSEAVISGNYGNDGNLFELCLNKFSLYDEDFSHAILIGAFVFAHNVDIHNQILNSTNNITSLYLNHCNYPSTDFKYEELSHNLNLSKLHIIGENIGCYFIVTLVQTIKEVDSVYIYDHTLSDEDVKYISFMLSKINSNNLGIWVVIGRTKILGNIPDMFTLKKQFSPLEICNLGESIKRLCSSSSISTTKFNKYIHFESKSVFEDFFYLLHEKNSKCEINFCLLESYLLIANGVKYGKISKSLSSDNHLIGIFIAKCKLNATELTNLIGNQESLEKLYIFDSSLDIHSFKYEHQLNETLRLKELFIHNTDSSYTLTFDLLEAKTCYPNISVLLITNNILIGHNPTCEQIFLSSKLEANLTVWRINVFPINIELLQKIPNTLSNVVELDITGCNLEEHEFQQCNNQSNDKQHNDYRISKQSIGKVLPYFTKLKTLNLHHNDLQEAGAGKLFKYLSILNLSKLNISHNEIDEQAVDDIAKLLTQIIILEELDLSCNNLQVTEVVTLFSEVQNTSSCTKLNVSHNNINDEAAQNIATFLSRNTQLKQLDLSHSNLQPIDAMAVCKGMSNLLHLTKLNIGNNNISGEAADYLAVVLSQNNLIEELDLSYNDFGAFSSLHIFHNMKKLSTLIKLNACSIGLTKTAADDIVNILNNNNELQELDISHNNIQATGATTIFKMASTKNLRKFIISHNNINDNVEFLETFLSRNTNLEELDFSHNNLQAAGAIKVCRANLSKLIKFSLSHNGITVEAADDIAAFLSHNTKLQVLNLSHSDLQEFGFVIVFKVLQNISVLISLKISDCNVIKEAVDELAIVLYNNISLQELDLSYNNLSKSNSATILKGMKNISDLITLNISHNNITDEAADELGNILLHNTLLQELDLSCNGLAKLDLLRIIKGMKNISNLITLNVSHNKIIDEAADSIATVLSHNSKLQTLNMSFNYLRSKGCIKIFNGMKNILYLSNLYISHNKIADEAAGSIAAVLFHNTKLKQLDISYNNLQTSGAIEIFQSIKHTSTLTKFNIAHNMISKKATEYIINILYNNTELKELNLSDNSPLEKSVIMEIMVSNVHKFNNSVSNQAANKLPKIITTLQELDLSNIRSLQATGVIKVFKELIHNSAFTKVNISRHPITQYVAYNLAMVLSKHNKLQELVMSDNNLQAEGIITILNAVKSSNLTKLNISANNINLIAVMNFLSKYTNLVELDLSYNKLYNSAEVSWFLSASINIFINLIKLNISGVFCVITDEAAADLAYVFSQSNELKELDLSDNNLYPEAASKILNGFKKNPTLIKFRISHNNISDQVASDIATFLCKCTNLEELDLSYNSLQDTGATEICRANISSLISFNISHNNITIMAADDVANFLSYNSHMQTFDLRSNGLLEVGVRNSLKDMQVVQSIFNLSVLNISDNSVINETISELITILLHNSGSLKEFDLSFNSLYISDAVNILQGMKKVSNFVTINLSHNNITDEAADELANVLLHNTSLQKIDLSCNNLSTSDAIKIFKGMKDISKLETINISHNMITCEAADELATVLSHNNGLQIFDMSSNHFSSEGCIKIMNGMSNILCLKKLDISCNQITYKAADSIATFLSHNSKLEEFILNCNDFQKSYLFKKIKSIKLTKLDVSFAFLELDDIATILMHNTKLEDINLSNNKLLSDGIIRICLRMKNILNLKRININNNRITCEAADDIANVLSQNINLQELYLSNNYLQSHGIVTLLNRMSNISKLTHLDISSNKITDEAADNIAVFLLHNSDLKVLDLSNNLIQAAGTRTIFGKRNTNFNLKKVDLSQNALDDEAADIMATFISQSPLLEEFNLSRNCLQALGAMEIFKAIQNCPNISKVNMSNNWIADEAGDRIAYVLSTVTKLQEVDLDYNLFSAEMSDYIKRAFIKLPY